MDRRENKYISKEHINKDDLFRQIQDMTLHEFKKYLEGIGVLNLKDLFTIFLFGFLKSNMTRSFEATDDNKLLREIIFSYRYELKKDLIETLKLMAKGYKNQEIAEKLETISIEAVAKRNRNIFQKLGVHNRRQASQKAIEEGLI